MRATQRLTARGYEAYLVGGCVRDLLLGRAPKDYDIATEARPQQIKRNFPRNCRIIGRRFKLAHLHFHDNTKILEVSTFRRTPQMEGGDGEDLLITRDNEFGTAEEDALRRDFTINALFLDPTEDRILDFTDGLSDLRARTIRTIGDPRVRFREDPVRILRAAKFAGRLGFAIEPETLAAMAEAAPDLVRAAPARLLEEVLRLLRGGHALDSFQLLRDVGAMRSILPVVADFLASAPQQQRVLFWRILEALDHRVQEGQVPTNPVLLGALFTCPVEAGTEALPGRSPSSIAEETLGPLSQTLRLSRRDAGCLKRICGVQRRFLQSPEPDARAPGFIHGPYFEEALELFELRATASGLDRGLVQHWRDLTQRRGTVPPASYSDEADDDETGIEDSESRGDTTAAGGQREPEPATVEGGSRRRRRRGRKRRSGEEDGAPEGSPAAPQRMPRPAPASTLQPTVDRGAAAQADESGAGEAPAPGPELLDAGERGFAAAEVPHAPGGEVRPAAEPGRRKRRRRRRRRGGDAFPSSTEPPPHGEPLPVEHAAAPAVPPAAAAEHDPNAPPWPEESGPQDPGPGGQQAAAPAPADAAAGERRRRRRRRRGRGRGRDGDGETASAERSPKPPAQPPATPPARGRRDRRGRGGRAGGKGDVDVVARHRDRRGRVEVLEPPPLDLSAFDVELDPKRVPTFGSIVEGKGRPKRRGPRVPSDGFDEYKPPPPPDSEGGPAPVPQPDPDADVFGDW